MSAPAAFHEVRYRPKDTSEDWTYERFPVGAEINLSGVVRGVTYVGDVCAISATGRQSAWTALGEFLVPTTNREGALALPATVAANAGIWDVDTEVEWSADNTSATISVSAGTLVIAGQTISYGASAVVVTGAAETTKTFYLYYDDPMLSGGTRTLHASETYVDMRNGDGRVPIVDVTITFPASGTSTGGGGIGGGFNCPAIDAWVFERDRGFIRACDVRVGDWLLMPGGRYGRVTFSERRQSPGVRLVTREGLSLRCSESAPIMTTDGYVPAAELIGRCVEIGGEPRLIEAVEPLGHIIVQHITLGAETDPCFLVGDAPGALFPHHNRKMLDDPMEPPV